MIHTEKRVLLFAIYYYYPSGGWHDLHGQYTNVASAKGAATKRRCKYKYGGPDEYQIIDLETGKELYRQRATWAKGWMEGESDA